MAARTPSSVGNGTRRGCFGIGLVRPHQAADGAVRVHEWRRRQQLLRVAMDLGGAGGTDACTGELRRRIAMNGSDSTRPRILGLLPRGEAIRIFAYSGALEELATGSDLTRASVIPSQEVLALLETKFGPILELDDHPQPWRAGIWHELLDLAHGRWLWSEAAQERWR